MNPASMAIGLASSLASGAMGAGGAIAGGDASARSSGYQAQIARISAGVARINRDQTLTAGAAKAEAAGVAGAQRVGQLTVAQAASGLDITKGTPALVRTGQQAAVSKDISTIYNNTARQAYGFEVEATNKEASAGMLDANAAAAKRAATMKALSTTLGTVSSVSGRWMDAKRIGVWGGDDDTISGESWTG